MAKIWTDVLVPLAIAGAVAAQTVGVEVHRAASLGLRHPSAQPDSVVTEALPDSIPAALPDSLDDEEFDFFADEGDTLPKVFARDTMKVPDSLRTTDPFLYKWYVATKDSYTHRVVVDSLLATTDTLTASEDSLTAHRIDSIFLADSTAAAKAALEKKLAGMTKAERKRWYFENVELPRQLHLQDSIFHVKDSLQAIRDSIRQNTPRILETAFLPDSLYYKRMVSWRHGSLFNTVETFEWDTTANYHFYDYPFMRDGQAGASWLGMPGSAYQSYNFFLRDSEAPGFYAPLEGWTWNRENLPQFNTKMPYTELEYTGNLFSSSDLAADNFRVFTTQNILPSLNVTLEMRRFGGAGNLQNEKTDNRSYVVAGNYLGKRYLAHGGFILNKSTKEESGGVQDNMWVRDTTVDVREINVNLAKASNRYRKMTFFYDQSYRIPFSFLEKLRHRGDSTWTPSDSLNKDITTAYIGTSSEYTTYTKKYVDNTSARLSAFYNDIFYINPSKSADSLRTSRLENRIFLRLQPWKEDAIVSKIEGGVGNRLQHFYLQDPYEALYKPADAKWNSFYAYAGVEGSLSRYLQWDATGLLNFAGQEAGDFFVKANAKFSFYPFRRARNSPVSLGACFETSLKEPEFYRQHFYSNHFKWENAFGKTSTTRISATLDIPYWNLKAQAGYALVSGYNYYDTQGISRQHGDALSVIMASVTHHLVLGPVHLENTALLQGTSAPDVLPLPVLALNARYYLQFPIVSPEVLKLQLGINTRYTTLWYAPNYNPVAGVFTLQDEQQYGNTPVTDIFINAQWKNCCVFFKYENAGRGWPSQVHDFFTAHHYIQTEPTVKFGISWPFHPQMGKTKTLSERAGSGFGGSSGGSSGDSALSGLRNSFGR